MTPEEWIDRQLENAPPITPEQQARLVRLLTVPDSQEPSC